MKTIWITGIVLFLFAASCSSDKQAKLQDLKLQYENIGEEIKNLEKEMGSSDTLVNGALLVQYQTIKPDTFNTFVEVQGHIDGEENVVATSKTVGVITQILVGEGQSVQKGQILARMDAGVLEQTLKEMEVSYEFITELYEKQKNLWEQKIGSEVQYLSAKNNKESMEMRIKTLKEQLEMYTIVSPINGTIEEIPIKVGQNMAPGLTAFRVVNFSRVKVVADISEGYSGSIKKGDQVLVQLINENIDYKGSLAFASRYINPVNRTFKVESYLDPKLTEFRANMIAVLKIQNYINTKAFSVPVNVVLKDKNEPYVLIAKNEKGKNIVQKAVVKTGKSYNGITEIISGLNEGDKVITSNMFSLRPGDIVNL